MRIDLNAKRGNPPTAAGAFTIIECLVAAALTAIIYAAVFAGVSTTFRLLNTTRDNLRATQIIVSRMEGLRLCAWNSSQLFNTNIVPTTFSDYFYPSGLSSGTNQGTVFYGTMTIVTNPPITPTPSYGGSLALVTVTLNWTNIADHTINAHTRTMSTLVAQYGLQNYIFNQ